MIPLQQSMKCNLPTLLLWPSTIFGLIYSAKFSTDFSIFIPKCQVFVLIDSTWCEKWYDILYERRGRMNVKEAAAS